MQLLCGCLRPTEKALEQERRSPRGFRRFLLCLRILSRHRKKVSLIVAKLTVSRPCRECNTFALSEPAEAGYCVVLGRSL